MPAQSVLVAWNGRGSGCIYERGGVLKELSGVVSCSAVG